MDIVPPPHIVAADLPTSKPTYVWDEAVDDEVMLSQPRIEHRIGRMSYRAAVAFSLGSLEWVLHRLKGELADNVPFQFLEAAWAGLVDWRYLKSLELPDWENEYDYDRSVYGPLDKSFWLLVEAIVAARRNRPFMETPVSLSEVALRVCDRPDAFKTWRRFAIERLTQDHPRDLEAPLGNPLSRRWLDPGYEPSPASDQAEISAFLEKLDWEHNRYLRSPDEMLAEGFKGTPYRWNPLVKP